MINISISGENTDHGKLNPTETASELGTMPVTSAEKVTEIVLEQTKSVPSQNGDSEKDEHLQQSTSANNLVNDDNLQMDPLGVPDGESSSLDCPSPKPSECNISQMYQKIVDEFTSATDSDAANNVDTVNNVTEVDAIRSVNNKAEQVFETLSDTSSDVYIVEDDNMSSSVNIVPPKIAIKEDKMCEETNEEISAKCNPEFDKNKVPFENMPETQLETHENDLSSTADNQETTAASGPVETETTAASGPDETETTEASGPDETETTAASGPDETETPSSVEVQITESDESTAVTSQGEAETPSSAEVQKATESNEAVVDGKNGEGEPSETSENIISTVVEGDIEMEVDEVDGDEEMEILPSVPVNASVPSETASTSAVEVNNMNNKRISVIMEVDNTETITGDKSLSEEAVLQNPDVNVCILSNASPDKNTGSEKGNNTAESNNSSSNKSNDGDKSQSNEASLTKPKSLIPRTVLEINEKSLEQNDPSLAAASSSNSSSSGDISATNADEEVRKKTLKVLYPKKKYYSGELDVVTVSPTLRDCLQCAKFTTCTNKVAISGIDCYLCSKECVIEQKLLHKKAVAVGSVVLLPNSSGDNGNTKNTEELSTADNVVVSTPTLNPAVIHLDDTPLSRLCTNCSKEIISENNGEIDEENGVLQWATMDFCSEDCLGKYQSTKGSHCQLCGSEVSSMSLGKYSVRFGYETRQFCSATCLEDFKKGLKACSYCQRDLNSDGNEESIGFLAPVGGKGQFKDFCSQDCLEKYDSMSRNIPPALTVHECAVCNKNRIVVVEVLIAQKVVKLCSDICFAAFRFVNENMKIGYCNKCKKYFDKSAFTELVMFYEDQPMTYCSKTCMNVQVLSKRKICPCNWCKVKKYNFDMIRKRMTTCVVYMCSLNCLALYQVSLRASIGIQKLKCDWCGKTEKANFHLTMSDASLRSFCTFECVDKFRGQYKIGTSLGPSVATTSSLIVTPSGVTPISNNTLSGLTLNTSTPSSTSSASSANIDIPIISSVHTLNKMFDPAALTGVKRQVKILPKSGTPGEFQTIPNVVQQTTQPTSTVVTLTTESRPKPASAVISTTPTVPATVAAQTRVEVLVKPRSPVQMKNKNTQVKVRLVTKGTSCRPNRVSRGVQTDKEDDIVIEKKILIPIPVPIFVPTPLAMYSVPVPTLLPVPVPIPVPVLVPTSRSSAKDILEDIKRIQDTFPKNPEEAELLTMAEAAARSEGQSNGTKDTHVISGNEENCGIRPAHFVSFESMNAMDDSSSYGGDDRASPDSNGRDPLGSQDSGGEEDTLLDVDMDSNQQNHFSGEGNDDNFNNDNLMKKNQQPLGKRTSDSSTDKLSFSSVKRQKTSEEDEIVANKANNSFVKPASQMTFKYTLGVNAWKYFTTHYNEDIQQQRDEAGGKANNVKPNKLLRTDLLEMGHEELNQALTLLMKEGKLPNGASYSPDTKYYLALGIQYYLLHNGRVVNLFSDPPYESFTSQLDKEALLFQENIASGNSIVTRVQEEHLWESSQLGVHSPHALLSTLMYLNTKYFNLTTIEEHKQLSFSHIIKRSTRGRSTAAWNDEENRSNHEEVATEDGITSNLSSIRNLVLKFYTPQSMLDKNPTKRKLYEQHENEEDPSRCPVRLYEFYLSRCPESVKNSNNVFYLQPERSCAPDSPVWYTNRPLPDDLLEKMLNRIKMVKEINLALVSQ